MSVFFFTNCFTIFLIITHLCFFETAVKTSYFVILNYWQSSITNNEVTHYLLRIIGQLPNSSLSANSNEKHGVIMRFKIALNIARMLTNKITAICNVLDLVGKLPAIGIAILTNIMVHFSQKY